MRSDIGVAQLSSTLLLDPAQLRLINKTVVKASEYNSRLNKRHQQTTKNKQQTTINNQQSAINLLPKMNSPTEDSV